MQAAAVGLNLLQAKVCLLSYHRIYSIVAYIHDGNDEHANKGVHNEFEYLHHSVQYDGVCTEVFYKPVLPVFQAAYLTEYPLHESF